MTGKLKMILIRRHILTASDLGLHFLLRPVSPNIMGIYGTERFITEAASTKTVWQEENIILNEPVYVIRVIWSGRSREIILTEACSTHAHADVSLCLVV